MPLNPKTVVSRWLPQAAIAAILCLLVYAAVQQSLRTGANDPQIQLAEDAAAALERGDALASVIPAGKVAIEASLAPFVIAYDSAGHPLAGSGLFHGQLTAPPSGVFDFVRTNGEERVTWQPERGVRIASVVTHANAKPVAFVLAGRSMREVEARVQYVRVAAAAALVVTLAATLVLIAFGELSLA
jgi:hypothetical protein